MAELSHHRSRHFVDAGVVSRLMGAVEQTRVVLEQVTDLRLRQV